MPHKSAAHFLAQEGEAGPTLAIAPVEAVGPASASSSTSAVAPSASVTTATPSAPESAINAAEIKAVPEDVCRCERGPDAVISIKNNRKGQEKRASYSIEMKAQVILEAYKSGMTQEKVKFMRFLIKKLATKIIYFIN